MPRTDAAVLRGDEAWRNSGERRCWQPYASGAGKTTGWRCGHWRIVCERGAGIREGEREWTADSAEGMRTTVDDAGGDDARGHSAATTNQ